MKERKIYKTEEKKERNMNSERKIKRMNRKTCNKIKKNI